MVKVIAVALLGGFLAGIVLSQIIGITGVLLFDRAGGVKFLPIYLAVVCVGVAPIVDMLAQRRAR